MAVFKSKLIHDKRYYQYQWYGYIAGFVGASIGGMFWGITTGWFSEPDTMTELWIVLILVLAYIPSSLVTLRMNRKIRETYGANKIEMNFDGITIGDRRIDAKDIKRIISIDPQLAASHEVSFWDFIKKLQGKVFPFFLKIKTKEGWERFDFMFESHYMMVQFRKILMAWMDGGKEIKFETNYEEHARDYQASEFST